LTLGTPRRVSASSMTSSWYSDPWWTSSIATAPVTASAPAGPSPPAAAYAAHSVRVGRMRFPPAPMRCEATSARKRSGVLTASWSESSTRARSSASDGSASVWTGSMRPTLRSGGNKLQAGVVYQHLGKCRDSDGGLLSFGPEFRDLPDTLSNRSQRPKSFPVPNGVQGDADAELLPRGG